MRNRRGRVYLIDAPAVGMTKVGFTSYPVELRLKSLQSGSPTPLVLAAWGAGGREYERALHELLARHWSHGEWFRDGPEVRDLVQRLGLGGALERIVDPAKYTRGIFAAHVLAGHDTERVRALDPDYVPAWVRAVE